MSHKGKDWSVGLLKPTSLFIKGHHLERAMQAAERRKAFSGHKTEKSSFPWCVRELASNEEEAGIGNNLDLKGMPKDGCLEVDEHLGTRPSSEGPWNCTLKSPCSVPTDSQPPG